MKPAYVCMIVPLVIFLTYYLKIYLSATDDIYYLEKLFPIPLGEVQYISILVICFIIGIIGIWLKDLSSSYEQTFVKFGGNNRIFRLVLVTYIVGFFIAAILTNLYPDRFIYLTYAITTGFASIVPFAIQNLVTITSFIAGIILFILSLIGIYAIGTSRNLLSRFIWLFYLFSYSYFVILFVIGILAPHRSMFFIILLPLIIATVVAKFNKIVARIFDDKKAILMTVRRVLRPIPVIIIAGFLIIAVVSRSNIDPSVRERINSDNIIEFGSTIPAIVTPQFLDVVKEYYTPGGVILSSPDTQSALYCILDIKPMSPDYVYYVINNYQWRNVVSALYYSQGQNPANWLISFNGTLLVVGYGDCHGGPKQYGYINLPVEKYDADPRLEKIYSDEFGQTIYQLNKTMYPFSN